MFVKIRGVRKYLWRAVDQHGNVLGIVIQSKRNGRAATRFFTIDERADRPDFLRAMTAPPLAAKMVSWGGSDSRFF
ncbi:DDE-type integrase/transposase/recombinase [Rhodococcus erythropolis]|uniref:DDE-type integrase/transposase/recombinase n=1 Tax=Rhodococcus erythropolis TaxID=1833 RepID=UPI002948C875|nr:DDE-type integrase/transposase/recombinase [Rhodococcus erythropolis]MDV6278847.1 DDE-type integrase/transposase/recombinase [Rhodococcus erythropolis]